MSITGKILCTILTLIVVNFAMSIACVGILQTTPALIYFIVSAVLFDSFAVATVFIGIWRE